MTDQYQRFIASKWFARRKNPRLRERLMRLNKNLTEGEMLRGWHPAPTLRDIIYQRNLVGKRWFINTFTRAAWDSLPQDCIIKQGRRAHVRREAVEDQAWVKRERLSPFERPTPPPVELFNLLEDLKAEAIKMMNVGGLAA